MNDSYFDNFITDYSSSTSDDSFAHAFELPVSSSSCSSSSVRKMTDQLRELHFGQTMISRQKEKHNIQQALHDRKMMYQSDNKNKYDTSKIVLESTQDQEPDECDKELQNAINASLEEVSIKQINKQSNTKEDVENQGKKEYHMIMDELKEIRLFQDVIRSMQPDITDKSVNLEKEKEELKRIKKINEQLQQEKEEEKNKEEREKILDRFRQNVSHGGKYPTHVYNSVTSNQYEQILVPINRCSSMGGIQIIPIIITTNGVYTGIENDRNGSVRKVTSLVYAFDHILTLKQLQLIWSIYELCSPYELQKDGTANAYIIMRKIESIIRIIPGSYKNGDWRQLDGFFGIYYNEKTYKVSKIPPPME